MSNVSSRDWRKKSHRLQKAKDEFKERNREKATKIKSLEGQASDLKKSRSQWKKKYEEKTQEIKRLATELAAKDELIEAEKKLRQQEAAEHAEELERLKKKWEMLQLLSQGKKSKKSLADTIRQFLS
jgi:DNA repair exonuclease SbcCD ATPase subunit